MPGIKEGSLHPSLRNRILGYPRETFHVAKAAAANFSYLSHNLETHRLHTTILSALQEVKAVNGYADIIVWPGQYKEAAVIDITNDSTRLLAAEMGPNKALTRTEIRQYGNEDVPCISIEGAHNCVIAGFRITPAEYVGAVGVNVGITANTYGTYIHDNVFYGVQGVAIEMPVLIAMGVAGSFNSDSTYITRNTFRFGGTHGGAGGLPQINWLRAHRAVIHDNSFFVLGNTTDSISILISSTNSPQEGAITDNRFYAQEGGTIKTINMTAAAGHVLLDGNHFINQAGETNCFTVSDLIGGINYWNEHAIGP